MTCYTKIYDNNFIRFNRIYGGRTLAQLQSDGALDICSVLDIDSKNQREAQEWCSKREHLFKKII